MVETNLFMESENHRITETVKNFSVLEYDRDLSVTELNAEQQYFASKMNIRKKQLAVRLEDSGVVLQAGAMQIMMGKIRVSTNVTGAMDLMKKMVGSKVTGETTIKPLYEGTGVVLLEPTYKHILLEEVENWQGGLVIEDGMFLSCSSTVNINVTGRNTVTRAVFAGEGLFNSILTGQGIVALESPVPRAELITIALTDDEVRIDGNMAVAWSNSLKLTVEKTTKTLVGSAVSGEGLVNVYRGTGKVWVAPVRGDKVRS